MADEQTGQVEKLFDPGAGIDMTNRTVDKLLAAASVEAVYGQPVQYADATIIPTAEVLSLAYVGSGSGGG